MRYRYTSLMSGKRNYQGGSYEELPQKASEDEGSIFIQNVGTFLPNYTVTRLNKLTNIRTSGLKY
jgi:hypothetical protein